MLVMLLPGPVCLGGGKCLRLTINCRGRWVASVHLWQGESDVVLAPRL